MGTIMARSAQKTQSNIDFNASDCVCLVLGIGHLSEKGTMEGGQAENGKIVHLLTSPGLQRRVLEKS